MIVNPLIRRRRLTVGWSMIIAAVLLSALAAVATVFFFQPDLPLRDPMFDDHAAQRQQRLRVQDQATEPGAVVLLGDSHLEFMENEHWWPGSLNLGIRGDTSAAVLDRMDSYQSLETARAVIISLGANDIAQGYRASQTVTNLHNIVSRLPEQIPVVLTGIHAMDESFGLEGYNRNILLWNQAYREAFAQSSQVAFVASPHAPADDSDNLAVTFHLGDGIHLNQIGYEIWLSVLGPAVEAVVNDVSRPN